MKVCDRCGKKIPCDYEDKTRVCLNIYETEGTRIGRHLDLCEECQREYENFKNKAQSYFFVSKENSCKIFNNVRFWNKNYFPNAINLITRTPSNKITLECKDFKSKNDVVTNEDWCELMEYLGHSVYVDTYPDDEYDDD